MSTSQARLSRRTLLGRVGAATMSLPLIEFSEANAQGVASLWDSAAIFIGDGGLLLGPDLVQCSLFDQNGKAIENGAVTVDSGTLSSTGSLKFSWRVNGGKLEGNFRFPDAKTTFAFTPIPGGAPNHFYLLLSDDHVLATDVSNVAAEGFFTSIRRVVTKCQYAVQLDVNGIPHPLAPFCTNCIYTFIR